MVTLKEAEHLLDHLSVKAITIQPTHCVCVRNRNATCHACIEVCPSQALTIKDNQISHDPDACIGCGCCVNICPTQALQTTSLPLLPFAQLLHALTTDRDRHHDVWICCQEHPLANENLERLIVIPCLAHLDESHYLLAAYYQATLHLLHPTCSSCPRASAGFLFESTLQAAQNLAKQIDLIFSFENLCEQTKTETKYPLSIDSGGYSRRGFFTNMSKSLKQLGYTVADSALEATFSPSEKQPSLAEQLTVAPGILETFIPQRITVLLNILYETQNDQTLKPSKPIDQSTQANDPTKQNKEQITPEHDSVVFKTRLWGKATIDATCHSCGMCALFCPTGALVFKGEKPKPKIFPSSATADNTPQGPNHEFRCSDCIQCHLCEDICPTKALHVDDHISTSDLLNLEPEKLKRQDTL